MIVLFASLVAAAPLAVGDHLDQTLQSIDGASVTLPDPQGNYVVLELIRSPDW